MYDRVLLCFSNHRMLCQFFFRQILDHDLDHQIFVQMMWLEQAAYMIEPAGKEKQSRPATEDG